MKHHITFFVITSLLFISHSSIAQTAPTLQETQAWIKQKVEDFADEYHSRCGGNNRIQVVEAKINFEGCIMKYTYTYTWSEEKYTRTFEINLANVYNIYIIGCSNPDNLDLWDIQFNSNTKSFKVDGKLSSEANIYVGYSGEKMIKAFTRAAELCGGMKKDLFDE